jgi:hypothetical protein
MSLVPFHRFLIGAGIVFCAGFSVYSFVLYSRTGNIGTLILAVGFLVAAAALTYYLRHLGRFLGLPGRKR